MKSLMLAFLALITLLFGVPAAVGYRSAPVRADTAIPVYGAPSYLDGSPAGGGAGYLNIADPGQAQYVVRTAAQLKSALAAATSGQVVYVADDAVITLTAGDMSSSTTGFYLRAGVTLASGRGRAGVTGGTIKLDPALHSHETRLLIAITGNGARVCGLNLIGCQEGTIGGDLWIAIYCSSDTNSAEIYNNEIHGFGADGVLVRPRCLNAWIHHNYIHHCQQSYLDDGVTSNKYGYGVAVGGEGLDNPASALIEGNIFDYCRHYVCGGRGRTSYIFRYNYLGPNAADTQVDCHGQNDPWPTYSAKNGDEYIYCAGENLEIYNNTSVTIGQGTGKCFVAIVGAPLSTGHISVHHNWTYQTEDMRFTLNSRNRGLGCINQQMANIPEYQYNAPWDGYLDPTIRRDYVRMSVYDNWHGTTPPPSANVAPVLSSIGNKSINEGSTFSFTVSASDADGDTLTYTASNLPPGATFDPATRTFSWTPSYHQAGVYAGTHFGVSDGQLTDSEDITITVVNVVQTDVNDDGGVNVLDMITIGQHWGKTGPTGWIPQDINEDGMIGVLDAGLIGQYWTG